MAALRTALERAGGGGGTALLLSGEPGSGKTRTAERLARAAKALGFSVHAARCHETAGAPALWPWLRIARAILNEEPGVACADLPAAEEQILARALPDLFPAPPSAQAPGGEFAEEGASRFLLFAALTHVVRAAARRAPRLLWIDDLHWADLASLELLRFALRDLEGQPIVFLGAYRVGEVRAGSREKALAALVAESSSFQLAGLSEAEVGRYMSQWAGFPVSAKLAAWIASRTAGNPLFVTEVVRQLEAEGRLGDADAPGPGGFALPVSVVQSLRRRLESVSPEALALLRAGAVAGTEFDREVVAQASGLPRSRLVAAFDELSQQRLLLQSRADGSHRVFAHDLLRDAVLEDLGAMGRGELHRSVADALVSKHSGRLDDHCAELAHHYARAPSPEAALLAGRHAVRAARLAMVQGSPDAAERLCALGLDALERAVPASERDAIRSELSLGHGHALWQLGQRSAARSCYLDVLQRAREQGEPERFARAALALAGRDDLAMQEASDDAELLEQALASVSPGQTSLRARLLASLVRARTFGETRERVEERANEAVALAESAGDAATLFTALEALHYALLRPEALPERLEIAARLEEVARRSGSARFEAFAEVWRVVDALEVPDPVQADSSIARLERIAQRTQQPFFSWLAMGFRATRATMQGRIEEAEQQVVQALELGRRVGTPNALPFFGTQIFHVREEQGRAGELEPVIQQLVEERPEMVVFRIGLPLIHALTDRLDSARAHFERIAERDFGGVPHDLHRLPTLTSAATVCACLDDRRRAALLREQLDPYEGRVIVAGIGTHWAGPADLYLARLERTLGDFDAAVVHAGRASELCARADAGLIRAHCLLERAEALDLRATATGSPEDGAQSRADRDEAAAIYASLGLEWRTRTPLRPQAVAPPVPAARFARSGAVWRIDYRGTTATLPHSKGLAYLERLLSAPGLGVHVIDLVTSQAADGTQPGVDRSEALRRGRGDGGLEILDARAVEEYRQRVRALGEARAEALAQRDVGRAAAFADEIGVLEAELRGALGLGGRARRVGSPVEHARKAVYNRIRAAIRSIGAVHPALGRHLERSVRTGTLCEYLPEFEVRWQVD